MPELNAELLRRKCTSADMQFAFATTADIDKLDTLIGQERATRAIQFGIDIHAEGYNIFAMGPTGAGKSSTILRYLQEHAVDRPAPQDWAYVRNPQEAYRPRALAFPSGRARAACNALSESLRQLDSALKGAFSGTAYEDARGEAIRQFQRQQQQLFRQLEAFAHQRSFALIQTPTGLSFVPMIDGKTLTPEEFGGLSEEQRQSFRTQEPDLEEAMEKMLRALQDLQQETGAQLSNLSQKVAEATSAPIFAALRQSCADCDGFLAYMSEVEVDVVQRVVERRLIVQEGESTQSPPGIGVEGQHHSWSQEYEMNVIVEHDANAGAPVVHEINPNYPNLMGKIEYRAEFGALVPDHHTIRAGALHQANGGYLVIDARALLSYPMAWEGLKRALRYRDIRIDEPAAQAGAIPAASLAPEPIPLHVKVVLIGDPETYYTLYSYDSSFPKLFKVRADFASDMAWSRENMMHIARFIRTRGDEEKLRDFHLDAVAEVVEYAGRLVESQARLTTRFAHVADIVREADYWAGKDRADVVGRVHVQRAIDERRYRSSLYEERLRRIIEEETIMVATEGTVVGQVNGLAIVSLGDYAFGKPTRITASTYLGSSGVINIERESQMSGSIHDKGVMILVGYLGSQYGQDKPLNLSASIAFEQSYDGVDGDSASATELYALLSSLSGLPIKQSIAVTGSVNQRGEIQAVGGTTAKIEGYFDLCQYRGLTGEHGVIIPAANVKHLMLRQDVIDAVAAGQFHIWPVHTVDQGFAILSGLPSGKRDADGRFPAGTFNRLVDDQLRHLAQALTLFSHQSGGDVAADKCNVMEVVPESEPELPLDLPDSDEGMRW